MYCIVTESAKAELEKELADSKTNNSVVAGLEADIKKLQQDLDQVNTKLGEANKELNKERAKSKSFSKHQQVNVFYVYFVTNGISYNGIYSPLCPGKIIVKIPVYYASFLSEMKYRSLLH